MTPFYHIYMEYPAIILLRLSLKVCSPFKKYLLERKREVVSLQGYIISSLRTDVQRVLIKMLKETTSRLTIDFFKLLIPSSLINKPIEFLIWICQNLYHKQLPHLTTKIIRYFVTHQNPYQSCQNFQENHLLFPAL